jgi:hypothetical protein
MSKEQTTKEKQYWRVYAALQELAHLSDIDVESLPEIHRHLGTMANIICFYQAEGVKKLDEALRRQTLEGLGITVLVPKPKK